MALKAEAQRWVGRSDDVATVGIQFESRKYSADSGYGFSQSDTTYGLVTTVQNNPWDIFAGNVAARYYF